MENNQYLCGLNHKPIKIIICLLLIVLVIFFGVKVANEIKTGKYIGRVAEQKNTITVTGDGEVYVKPDLGLISFSVVNEAKTVEVAMSENTAKMNNIISAIKGQGVKEEDIKTTYFNINPRYEYPKDTSSYYYSGKRVLVGYEVNQSLQVKIRDLTKIGTLISKATEAGANDVGSLSFTVDNEDDAKKQARDLAIEKARAKAQELAGKLGVSLLKIVSFGENGYYPYYDTSSYKSAVPMGAGEESIPDIQTGQNRISSTVSITYEIN
ncbi:MAG: SIMPL domain-containing protein [Candidatus Pacebacteria bacterium]|nr:SIMPL domain-containing protein [Candidatus Paceibacterota bacterium]MDD5621463.1 SIMPL domain-containing protein [Candidatus Paceibacterota bacterium]